MTSDPIRRWSRSAASRLEEHRTRVDDEAMSSARLRTPLSFLTLILGTALAAESPPIPIDGIEDWVVIEQQVRDAVAHEVDSTGLILTRDDRPVAYVAVTADGFGETTTDPAGVRWLVPLMHEATIDDMPAWGSIRIPDADESSDTADADSRVALRDPFDAHRPPPMRSRSDWPRPALARGGVMFVPVPLSDGRTVLVPRVSVTPRMPGS